MPDQARADHRAVGVDDPATHRCNRAVIGLSVGDLDAWVAKLRGENVKFLEQPYKLGDTRAVMIEGPSREALELVEVKP